MSFRYQTEKMPFTEVKLQCLVQPVQGLEHSVQKVGGKYIQIHMVEYRVGLIALLSSPVTWKRADALSLLFSKTSCRVTNHTVLKRMSLFEGVPETLSHVFLYCSHYKDPSWS